MLHWWGRLRLFRFILHDSTDYFSLRVPLWWVIFLIHFEVVNSVPQAVIFSRCGCFIQVSATNPSLEIPIWRFFMIRKYGWSRLNDVFLSHTHVGECTLWSQRSAAFWFFVWDHEVCDKADLNLVLSTRTFFFLTPLVTLRQTSESSMIFSLFSLDPGVLGFIEASLNQGIWYKESSLVGLKVLKFPSYSSFIIELRSWSRVMEFGSEIKATVFFP